MARVTVEDCIEKIPNRFDLCLLAGQRAREISVGAEITIDRDNDKNPVVALREIADETISLEEVEDALIQGLQMFVETEEPEEEELEILAVERELAFDSDLSASEGEFAAPNSAMQISDASGVDASSLVEAAEAIFSESSEEDSISEEEV